MVSIKTAGKNRNQVYIAVLDFPYLLKAFVHDMDDLGIWPIQLSKLLQNLFQCLLVQISVDQFSNISFERWSLFLYNGRPIRWIGLWYVDDKEEDIAMPHSTQYMVQYLIVSVLNHEDVSVVKMLDIFLAHNDFELVVQSLVTAVDTEDMHAKLTMLLIRIPVSGDFNRKRPHVSNRLQTTSMFWLVKSSRATLNMWKIVWGGVILNFVSSARYRIFCEMDFSINVTLLYSQCNRSLPWHESLANHAIFYEKDLWTRVRAGQSAS
jgi:hypothetical protein